MSSDWRDTTLGQFIRLQRGHDLTATEQKPGKVPIMGSAGPNGTHSTARAEGPGVVVGRSGGSAGRVHFSEVDYWPHNTCLYVTDFLGNNPRYCYYLLQTLNLASFNSGSAQASINRNFLYPIKLRVPERPLQDRIAALLQSIDHSITNSHRTNTALESTAQTLFLSWFVNFDPVHAKAAGNEPEAMSPELAALFPSEFEESELGRIPKGWDVSPYAEAIEIYSGGTPKTNVEEYWNGDISWFSVTDAPAPGQVFVLKTEKHITKIGLEKSPAKLLPTRSTIISARGTVGKIGMVSGRMTINQSCYALAPKNGQGAYWTYFQTKNLVSTLKQMAHGGVFDTITRDTFRGVKVASPTDAIFDAFSNAAMPLFDAIECNGRLVICLTELRDHLIPRLISGKLSLEVAEAAVADITAGLKTEPA